MSTIEWNTRLNAEIDETQTQTQDNLNKRRVNMLIKCKQNEDRKYDEMRSCIEFIIDNDHLMIYSEIRTFSCLIALSR